jgi:hypothetical protein
LKPLDQRFQLAGLDVVVDAGPDEGSDFFKGQAAQTFRGERPGLFEVFYRSIDVAPGDRLGENGPDHHLERPAAGPPVLGAESGEKPVINFQ